MDGMLKVEKLGINLPNTISTEIGREKNNQIILHLLSLINNETKTNDSEIFAILLKHSDKWSLNLEIFFETYSMAKDLITKLKLNG